MNSLLQNPDLKVKKVGKTARPFRYDLNQITYHYTVEVMNRFKELDLVDRMSEKLWKKVRTLYRRWWPKPSQERQIDCLRRLYR